MMAILGQEQIKFIRLNEDCNERKNSQHYIKI